MTKFNSSRQPSATQTVAKKHLKTHLKRIRNREYCRLRDMVPAVANKQKVSKVMVIEEAVRYIDELHLALASRLTNKDMFSSKDCHKEEKIKQLIHSFIPANFYERKPPTIDFEKQQRLPTYLIQPKVKKPSTFSNAGR